MERVSSHQMNCGNEDEKATDVISIIFIINWKLAKVRRHEMAKTRREIKRHETGNTMQKKKCC